MINGQQQLGPVERGLDWVVNNVAGDNDALLAHYRANRNAWNTGIVGGGLTLASLLAHGAINAFRSDADKKGGDSANPWGWLLPMGLVGGGLWLYNKYGDRVSKALRNYEDASQGAKNVTDRTQKLLDTAESVKNAATEAAKQTVTWPRWVLPGHLGVLVDRLSNQGLTNTAKDLMTWNGAKSFFKDTITENLKSMIPGRPFWQPAVNVYNAYKPDAPAAAQPAPAPAPAPAPDQQPQK